MSSSLGRLNLRPSERRVLVGFALVLFAVLNVVFVWPYFGQWKVADKEFDLTNQKLDMYRSVVKDQDRYKKEMARIQNENPDVPLEDQLYKLGSTIYGEASKDGVTISGSPSATTKTNEFFIQQAQKINFTQTEEANLVHFIFNLGSGESLIRVQSLTIRPEIPARQRLGGDVTLMASYQRKAPGKASPGSAAPRTTTATLTTPVPAQSTKTNAASTRLTATHKSGTKGGVTNVPAAKSWWTTVKGWFGGSSASSKTNVPGAATSTNKTGITAPAKK
jgi:hypothetical protein